LPFSTRLTVAVLTPTLAATSASLRVTVASVGHFLQAMYATGGDRPEARNS